MRIFAVSYTHLCNFSILYILQILLLDKFSYQKISNDFQRHITPYTYCVTKKLPIGGFLTEDMPIENACPPIKQSAPEYSPEAHLAAACRCRRRTRLQIQTFDFSCRYFLCLCDHIARHSVQMKNLLPIQIIFLFIMANEARLCMCPVSYTHLDVYKRQRPHCTKGGHLLAAAALGSFHECHMSGFAERLFTTVVGFAHTCRARPRF